MPSVLRRSDYLAAIALLGGLGLGVALAVHPAPVDAIVTTIVLGCAALIWPQHLTIALIAIIYSNTPAVLVRDHGLPSVLALAITLALALPLFYRVLVRKESISMPRVLPAVLLFGVVEAISAIGAADVHAATLEVASFVVEGALVFVLVAGSLSTTAVLHRAIWAVVLTGGVLGLLSLVQQVTGSFDQHFFGYAEVSQAVLPGSGGSSLATTTNAAGQTGLPRLAGPIGEKNRYAQILVILVPMALSLVVLAQRRLVKALAWLALVLCIGGMVLTYSRGAAVGLAAGLAVALLLRLLPVRVMVGVLILVAVTVAAVPTYRDRVLSLQSVLTGGAGVNGQASDNAIRGRVTENLAAALAIVDHPLVGVGPGAFPSVYAHYAGLAGGREHLTERESHNLYLGVGAELGLVGLGTLLWMLASVGSGLWRGRRFQLRAPPEVRTHEAYVLAVLCSGLFASFVTYLVTGLFLHLSYQRYFWFFLALCAAACTLSEHRSEEPAPRPPRGLGERAALSLR